jgi:hypothetical protein
MRPWVVGRVPLGTAHHEGRRRELGDAAGVADVQVGHHHGSDPGGVDAPAAQLGGERLPGLHLQVAEGERAYAPEALGGLDRNGGMEPGVDQDRPGAGVL